MTEEIKQEKTVEYLTEEIRELLKDISVINANTQRNDDQCVDINFFENPLDPNLLAYCFDVILGFDVRYRIYEKNNFIKSILTLVLLMCKFICCCKRFICLSSSAMVAGSIQS